MSRSKWKGPYIKILGSEISRAATVVPQFIGLTFLVHNGQKNKEITVSESMIGHKFGEFFETRARYFFKKKKKKKKR
jgi:small subunit ribosomal protein S19